MLEVLKAEYRGGYELWIEFSDGQSGVIDLEEDLWGPMFEPLRDRELFKQFQVSDEVHTIVWPNDADFAPEHLLKKLKEQTRERV